MREIIFRGKTDKGKWVEGYYVEKKDVDAELSDFYIVDKFEYTQSADFDGNLRDCVYAVIPETIGQYTGLTDKNGTKIFEGDILEVDVYEYETETYSFNVFGEIVRKRNKKQTGRKIKVLWTVEYKEHFCRGYGFYAYGKDRRFNIFLTKSRLFNANAKVIGNIHDNPELLKGGAE